MSGQQAGRQRNNTKNYSETPSRVSTRSETQGYLQQPTLKLEVPNWTQAVFGPQESLGGVCPFRAIYPNQITNTKSLIMKNYNKPQHVRPDGPIIGDIVGPGKFVITADIICP